MSSFSFWYLFHVWGGGYRNRMILSIQSVECLTGGGGLCSIQPHVINFVGLRFSPCSRFRLLAPCLHRCVYTYSMSPPTRLYLLHVSTDETILTPCLHRCDYTYSMSPPMRLCLLHVSTDVTILTPCLHWWDYTYSMSPPMRLYLLHVSTDETILTPCLHRWDYAYSMFPPMRLYAILYITEILLNIAKYL